MENIVGAVIVAFHPKLDALKSLTVNLAFQTTKVVVVDNTPMTDNGWGKIFHMYANIELITLGDNKGIAFAQNLGIRRLIDGGCNLISIFDQDSEISSSYISDMMAEWNHALMKLGMPIAVAGPNFTNLTSPSKSPFFQFKWGLLRRIPQGKKKDRFCKPLHLISSGSILSADAYGAVGPLRDELFIDYVDTDWCLRACQQKYAVVGFWHVRMLHKIGDSSKSIFGKKISFHSPLRHYYFFRNAVFLYLFCRLPLGWKFADAVNMAIKFVIYSFIGSPKEKHFRAMILGCWDGLTRNLGPCRRKI